MKSTENQLKNRGFVPEDYPLENHVRSTEGKLELLNNPNAIQRTIAARLLKHEEKYSLSIVNHLINALSIEKQLYTKLELSDALIYCKEIAVLPLIEQLGKIGNNQHRVVPDKEFLKNSYPLPRDIAARILAKLGTVALAQLLVFIKKANILQLSEAIDAIGFICFYTEKPRAFAQLNKCYVQHENNELIKWKILRACSGFANSCSFLSEEKQRQTNLRLQLEIDRSFTLAMQKKRF